MEKLSSSKLRANGYTAFEIEIANYIRFNDLQAGAEFNGVPGHKRYGASSQRVRVLQNDADTLQFARSIGDGEKMLNVVNTLEARGYRVNLYAADVCHPQINYSKYDKTKALALFVKIKDSGKHLNISKVAYPLANPAFLRYHVFKWYDTMLEDLTNTGSTSCNAYIPDILRKTFPNGCFWESFYTVRNKTEKEIIENILNKK